MTDLETVVTALQERVQRLDDQAAIYQIIANYGPAADSGWSEMAASLWTEDGIYDAQVGAWQGRPAIAGMIAGETHQNYIHEGCAHILTMPYITIDGDTAVATCYGQLMRIDGDNFRVWRVTATRWELHRDPDGWRIANRVNKLLNGDPAARDLLRQGLVTQGMQR
jgi:hypothetical protein